MSDDTHEIYAIRYGHHDRKSPENFIGGDPHDVLQPLDFYVWAIVGPSGPIILDTGFDAAMGRKRQREMLKPVGEGLKALGIEAAKVRTVIISHMHYDHIGNYDLFPRARYHLQDCEMAYATGRCMCHTALRVPFEVDDVVAMVRKVFDGRVAFHDGEDEVAPGIFCPPYRRSLKGPAERAGEDAAWARGIGGRRRAPLHPYGNGPHLPDHLQRRRSGRRIRDAQKAR